MCPQDQHLQSTSKRIVNNCTTTRRHRNQTLSNKGIRTKTFARLPITAEETTTSQPAKRRNFVPSEREKFTASTVRKGKQKETPMVAERRAGTSTTINNQTTVAQPEPTPEPPYTNVMEPQPGPSSHRNVPSTPLLTGLLENKNPVMIPNHA